MTQIIKHFQNKYLPTNRFLWLPNTAILSELISATTYCEIAKFLF